MYDERPYGELLRDERERNGYDLNSMSRRLHIRPDILMAIEQSDFDRMPARGYSKNMVRAYARALHLDERAITDMFLDQARMFDMGESRRPSGSRSSRSSSRNRNYSTDMPPRSRSRRDSSQRGSYSDSRSFDLASDYPASSRRRSDYSQSDSRSRSYDGDREGSRSRQLDGGGSSRGSGFSAAGLLSSLAGRTSKQETRVGRSFDTIGATPPYARNNVGRSTNSLSGMNLPLLLIIVAAVIALIIVVVVVTNGSHQAVQNVPDIPISGLTDTSGTDDGSSSSSSDADDVVTSNNVVLPTDAEVVFEVADGQDSWIEVYEDGSSTPSLAEVITGPFSNAYDVAKTIRIRTANPSAVSVTVEGDKVELTSEGNGYHSYTFDFQDYLKQWKKDNGVEDSSSSKSSSSSSKSSSS